MSILKKVLDFVKKFIKTIFKICVIVIIITILAVSGLCIFDYINEGNYKKEENEIVEMYNKYLEDNNITKENYSNYNVTNEVQYREYIVGLPSGFQKITEDKYAIYDDDTNTTGAYVYLLDKNDNDNENRNIHQTSNAINRDYIKENNYNKLLKDEISSILFNLGMDSSLKIVGRTIHMNNNIDLIFKTSNNLVYQYSFISNEYIGKAFVFYTYNKDIKIRKNIIIVYENVEGKKEYMPIFDRISQSIKCAEVKKLNSDDYLFKDVSDVVSKFKKHGIMNIKFCPEEIPTKDKYNIFGIKFGKTKNSDFKNKVYQIEQKNDYLNFSNTIDSSDNYINYIDVRPSYDEFIIYYFNDDDYVIFNNIYKRNIEKYSEYNYY